METGGRATYTHDIHHGLSLSAQDRLVFLNVSGVEYDVNAFLKGEGVSRKFAWL